MALVVALGDERRALERALASPLRWWAGEFRAVSGRSAGRPVVLIQAGIGRERARQALAGAARWFDFRAAWSLGFAGGLAEQLRPGDLVCPSVVLLDDRLAGKAYPVSPMHAVLRAALSSAGIPCHDGPLLTVEAPLRTPQAKREAHRRAGAVAVDMEGAGLAEAAAALGIPWLAVKAIVDGVDDPLPEFLAGCTTPEGDLRWRGVLWSLVSGGERRRTLRRLSHASRRAARALAFGLEAILRTGVP